MDGLWEHCDEHSGSINAVNSLTTMCDYEHQMTKQEPVPVWQLRS
jgi:hypothetical protein